VLLSAFTSGPLAQSPVTTPQAEFGHNFGDDYFLANYRQLSRPTGRSSTASRTG
jgi:hypothetical protein